MIDTYFRYIVRLLVLIGVAIVIMSIGYLTGMTIDNVEVR